MLLLFKHERYHTDTENLNRTSQYHAPLQTIAAYLCFHLGRLDKLQGKVMTQKLEWWIILMVDCVTRF